MRLGTQHDRAILALALPALGSLAAEPLYVLADTAIVGHLGRHQLAALGIAASVLSVLGLFNFLAYGTTAHVARAAGAGEADAAAAVAAQALWLSVGLGLALAAVVAGAAGPVVSLFGAGASTARYAETYLRIAAIGVPSVLVAMGGQGYLRGVGDLRTPLLVLASGNVLNVVLEVVLVYVFHLGIRGSAWGTAAAQTAMGALFLHAILRSHGDRRLRPALARRLLALGGHIFVRTAALLAAFVLAGLGVARAGTASLAAHQVAFQLWLFLALVLDALAIAAQVLVGQALGAGRADDAYAAGARTLWLATLAGVGLGALMLALGGVLPRAFTGDAAVLDRVHAIWPLFALMQPLNAIVFALDGILIGAGDGRYLMWAMLTALPCSAAVAAAALVWHWGIVGIWSALVVLIAVRLATLAGRFAGRRWAVTGWA